MINELNELLAIRTLFFYKSMHYIMSFYRKYSPYNFRSVMGAITDPHLKSFSSDFKIIDAT